LGAICDDREIAVVELWKDLGERLKALAGAWAVYTALGSFALYLVGYLSLRFHLTTLGLGTDLAILDERYLFAGAKFLVYLMSSIPIVVMIGLVLFALAYTPYRVLAARRRTKPGDAVKDRWDKIWVWWSTPQRLTLTGIVFSVTLIQVVMRQCFVFSNLLVAADLPPPAWFRALLLAEDEGLRSLYFAGLMAGTAGTAGMLLAAQSRPGHTDFSRVLSGLLALLLAIQILMLPVNYGILLADKTLPKVANLGASEDVPHGQEAWLVWEGKDSITYLVRHREADQEERALVTLPRGEVKQIRIIAYDPILRVLFAEARRRAPPHTENGQGEH
jgi:hypothetical protein